MTITTGTFPGVRIVDMPNLGAVTDASSFVGELAGSGRFTAPALKTYSGSSYLPSSGGTVGGDLTVLGALNVGGTIAASALNVEGTIAAGAVSIGDDLVVSGATTLNTLHVQGSTNLDGITTTEQLRVLPGADGIFATATGGFVSIGGAATMAAGANLYLSGQGRDPYAIEFYWLSTRIGWWTTGGNFQIIGTASRPGGGAWVDSSDARIKTVTGDYTHGLAEVLQLHPKTFTFRGNELLGSPTAENRVSPHAKVAADKTEFVGVIAQDVEAIFPEMVTDRVGVIDGVPVTDLKMLDTTALLYALVNSVQKLEARIAALEAA